MEDGDDLMEAGYGFCKPVLDHFMTIQDFLRPALDP
jgi:hypothetical protein